MGRSDRIRCMWRQAVIHYSSDPVADAARYMDDIHAANLADDARRADCMVQRADARAKMLGNWNFIAEKISEIYLPDPQAEMIVAGFRNNDDAEIGAAIRKIVESSLDTLLDDVTEGIQHEGSMSEMLKWWSE